MRNTLVLSTLAALVITGAAACKSGDGNPPSAPGATAQGTGGGRAAAGRGVRPPMPVEFATVKRAPVTEQILVVGNLIGAATVQVVPRVNGRLAAVAVQL